MAEKKKSWYQRWRLRRFHRRCDRLRIPADVRGRLLKMGDEPPDWYAGQQTPEPEPTVATSFRAGSSKEGQ